MQLDYRTSAKYPVSRDIGFIIHVPRTCIAIVSSVNASLLIRTHTLISGSPLDIRPRPPFLPLILFCDVSTFLLDDIFSYIGSLSLLNIGLAVHGDFATRGLNIKWINVNKRADKVGSRDNYMLKIDHTNVSKVKKGPCAEIFLAISLQPLVIIKI